MTRFLAIPGVMCLFGFILLLGSMSPPSAYSDAATAALTKQQPGEAALFDSATMEDATQLLEQQLLVPWEDAHETSYRTFSRVAVSRVEIPNLLVGELIRQAPDLVIGSVITKYGESSTHYPVIVNQTEKTVTVFSDRRWQPNREWLASHAPATAAARLKSTIDKLEELQSDEKTN